MASDAPVAAAPLEPAAAPASSKPARKEPPPEKPSDVTRRSYIVLSFWVIVVLLGLPIWWQTTSTYRASLPLDAMLRWADGKACRPVFPLQIAVRADGVPEADALHLVKLTQHAIDDLNDFSGHHLRLRLASGQSQADDAALTVRLQQGDSVSSSLSPHSPVLDIAYPPNAVPSVNTASSTLATYIANELQSTFAEEQAIISNLLSTSASPSTPSSSTSSSTAAVSARLVKALSPEVAEALSKRTTRSLRYAPEYHLTFSLFTAGPLPNTWDVDAAIREYIQPVLDVLRPIHNFAIDTQVQLYAAPGAQSQVLDKDGLASFINAAEWPLSPSIGGAPTVNFLTYVGNQTIGLGNSADDTSQSWMIPQWGTVYLLPLADTTTHVTSDMLKQPMLTFAGHLLSLLGTPHSGSLPLRLSTLSRIRSADLLLRASSTLGSLARLSLALPSIPIPRSVADAVSSTMHHLEEACAKLGEPEGLMHARIAEAEVEKAFFEKSMVGQLYFPDEHKVAVYLPLLGPVAVPLVLGLVTELRGWIKRRRQRAQDAKEKKGN